MRKFHPDANNHAVPIIEAAGREAELLTRFFHNSVATAAWDKNLGIDGKQRPSCRSNLWALRSTTCTAHVRGHERYEFGTVFGPSKEMIEALRTSRLEQPGG